MNTELEGIIIELNTMIDNAMAFGDGGISYGVGVPVEEVEALRDRLKFVLDNTPDD